MATRRQQQSVVGVVAPKEDLVNHPSHYSDRDGRSPEDGGVECCQAIRAMLGREGYVSYLRASIASQNWRLGRKDDGCGGVRDAEKLIWYAAELRAVLAEEA